MLCAAAAPRALLARPAASRKHVARPRVVRAAWSGFRDEDAGDLAEQVLGGEWQPTLSWSLPTQRMPSAPQPPSPPRGHADEEGIEPINALGGEWDARSCSLASYDDVMEHFNKTRESKARR